MSLPRFHLRTLMIATALTAAVLSPFLCLGFFFFATASGASAFNKAVAPFEALGATVIASGGNDGGRLMGAAGVKTIGCDGNFGDAELAKLSGRLAMFPNLQLLILSGPNVTHAGISQLKGVKSLESLHLRNTRATDAGIADLRSALPRLKVER